MIRKNSIICFLDILLIISAFFLTNSTSFTVIGQFPNFLDANDPAWPVLQICFIVLILLVIQLWLTSLGVVFIKIIKFQIPLLVFILYSIFSIFWTTGFLATAYELTLMIFGCLMGVYLAAKHTPESVLDILVYYGAFCVLLSIILVFQFPGLARLNNPTFLGAWRGIFWHRNHLGSLAAFFSAIFLLKAWAARKQLVWVIGSLVLFLLALILVIGSRSATGIVIFIVLNGLVLLAFTWLQYKSRLEKKHYFIIGGIAILVIVFFSFNLNIVFSLLNRSSTLTGRTPVWSDLITRVWVQKPVLGFGFGALWNNEAFRVDLQTRHGWPYQVYFADNGFLDILLNTGIIGLISFLLFFITTGYRAISTFIKKAGVLSLLPVVLFSYVTIANISYSFLFEVDQFVWMLLILAAILSFKLESGKIDPNNKISKPQPYSQPKITNAA